MTMINSPSNTATPDPRNIGSLVGKWVRPGIDLWIEHRVRSVDFIGGKLIAHCGRKMSPFATQAGVYKPGDIRRCAVCEVSEKPE